MAIILRDKTTPSQQAAIQSDGSLLIQPQAITKGTQGANGFTTQDLKDSGRVAICWTLSAVAAIAATESIMTVTESRDGATTSTHASYTITSGKRLRIQHLNWAVANTTGTTIGQNFLRIRFNTAGAATNSSALVFQQALITTAAANVLAYSGAVDFPDGLEFLGDGTKQIAIGWLSPQWVTASVVCSIWMSLVGFEY